MSDFNLKSKRRELRKKVRRRKLIFRVILTLIIFTSLSISIKILNKDEVYINNKLVSNSIKPKKNIICIDPGHGDWDSGSIGYQNSLEKDIVLKIGLSLGNLLEENENFKVIYTRTNDLMPGIKTANDSLKERLKISKIFKSDIFVSIHCNSDLESKDIKGIETWYNPSIEESLRLSTLIQENLVNLNYTSDRGLKTYTNKDDAFAVLDKNSAIPTLVELGFLSNYFDEEFLNSENGQSLVAKAIYEAILEYYDLSLIEE